MYDHCMKMWACTPQRACDLDLVLHSAAWYESIAPWLYAGLHAMVSRTLDASAIDDDTRDPIAERGGNSAAANEHQVYHASDDAESRSSRATRWGRQRGG